MNRDLEEDLVPLCRELGIGIVACARTGDRTRADTLVGQALCLAKALCRLARMTAHVTS